MSIGKYVKRMVNKMREAAKEVDTKTGKHAGSNVVSQAEILDKLACQYGLLQMAISSGELTVENRTYCPYFNGDEANDLMENVLMIRSYKEMDIVELRCPKYL